MHEPVVGPIAADRVSPLRAVLSLLALALSMAIAFTVLGSFSTVQEGAKAELALSDYSLSLIQGLAVAIPLALFSVPIGVLVDRLHRVRLLIALALLWTIGTALTGFAASAPILFVARMIVGIGATGALTAALSLAADLCLPEQRGRALLLVNLGKSLGIAAAFALAGALFGLFAHGGPIAGLATLAPWRSVHVVLAVLSMLLLLPVALLREPARHEVAVSTHAPFRVVAGELWGRRRFLIPLFVGQVSVVMADTAANIWAAPVLSRNYGLTPDQFAGWMGALLFSTGVVGAILGGFAADIGQRSLRRGGILLGAVIAAAIGVPAALFPLSGSVALFAVALGTLALAGAVTGLITSVALTVLIPNELRGLCIGAFIAVAGVIGFGIAPVLVAAVSGVLGGEAHLGAALAIVGTVVGAISVIGFFDAMRHAPVSATAEPI